MSIAEDYTDKIYNERKLYASYPPISPVNLGDYGIVDGRRFIYLGNISNLPGQQPIPFAKTPVPRSGATVEFKSGRVTRVAFAADASGTINGAVNGKAGLKFDFKSDFSIFCTLAGCREERIQDVDAVGAVVLQRYDQDLWDKDWCVVTSVLRATSTTVIISSESNTSMVLQAEGGAPKIDLADVELKLEVSFDSTDSDKWITEKTPAGDNDDTAEMATPFFKLSKVNTHIFSPDEFGPAAQPFPNGQGAVFSSLVPSDAYVHSDLAIARRLSV